MGPRSFIYGESPGGLMHAQRGPDWCSTKIGGTAASSGSAALLSAFGLSGCEHELKPKFEDFFYQATLFNDSGFSFGLGSLPLLDHFAKRRENGKRSLIIPIIEPSFLSVEYHVPSLPFKPSHNNRTKVARVFA